MMQEMYDAGQALAREGHRSYTEALWTVADLSWAECDILGACHEAGYHGRPMLRWARGWRYGRVPECGRSRNYRDDHAEAGVSMMEVEGCEGPADQVSALFVSAHGRPRVTCEGWLVSRTGSDGEPLLVGARECA